MAERIKEQKKTLTKVKRWNVFAPRLVLRIKKTGIYERLQIFVLCCAFFFFLFSFIISLPGWMSGWKVHHENNPQCVSSWVWALLMQISSNDTQRMISAPVSGLSVSLTSTLFQANMDLTSFILRMKFTCFFFFLSVCFVPFFFLPFSRQTFWLFRPAGVTNNNINKRCISFGWSTSRALAAVYLVFMLLLMSLAPPVFFH